MTTRNSVLAAVLVLASCLAAPRPGIAATNPPIFDVEDGAPAPDASVRQSAAGVCVLSPAPRVPVSNNFLFPNYFTRFAWRIPLSSCTACPAPQNLAINTVSLSVRWFSACAAQAEVSIVGVTGPPECRTPDPTNVLCGPTTYPISGAGAGAVVYSLPLTPACCVTGEAFALVRFIGFDACPPGAGNQSPGIGRTDLACVNCEQYYSYEPVAPSLTEWCAPGKFALWMEVDADCCVPTDIDGRSWGKIKTLYR